MLIIMLAIMLIIMLIYAYYYAFMLILCFYAIMLAACYYAFFYARIIGTSQAITVTDSKVSIRIRKMEMVESAAIYAILKRSGLVLQLM